MKIIGLVALVLSAFAVSLSDAEIIKAAEVKVLANPE